MWPFNKRKQHASRRPPWRGHRLAFEPLEDRQLLNADFGFAIGIGGNDRDQGHDVAIDTAGNVYATGQFLRSVDFDPGPGTMQLQGGEFGDAFISKFDANGNLLWAHDFGSERIDTGASVALDGADNVYTVGTFGGTVDFDPGGGTAELTASGFSDGFISKLDSDGDFIWARPMGATGQAGLTGVAIDAAGDVIIAGSFNDRVSFGTGPGAISLTTSGQFDMFVAKLNADGDAVWARGIGGPSFDGASAVDVDAGGNIVISGSFRETVDFDPGPGTVELVADPDSQDAFAAKLDGDGNLVWAKRFGGVEVSALGSAIGVNGAGEVYAAGTFNGTIDADPGPRTFTLTSDESSSAFITKLSAAGEFVWAKKFPGGQSPGASIAIDVDAAGSVFATGRFAGAQDFDPGPGTFEIGSHAFGSSALAISAYIVQLDIDGDFVWAASVVGDGLLSFGNGIDVDDGGQLATTGAFRGTGDFDLGPGVLELSSDEDSFDIYISKMTLPPVGLSIGDRVWIDARANGRFDAGVDIAVSGVTLTVYRDDGASPNELDAADTLINTAVTNAGGFYRFIGLPPGDYLVQVDESNFEPGGVLAGRESLFDPAPAADPDDDIDNDDNGLRVLGAGVVAQAVTLQFGAEPNREDGNRDTNLTVDFGFACGTTVTNTNDSGPGSLREAIMCANTTPGLDTVDFNIAGAGVHTIQLNSALPQITDAAIIDGTTQDGFAGTPLIELDGSMAGDDVSGLTIARRGGGTTIRGLAINRFDRHGIFISRSDGNRIQQNFIGTDPSGTVDVGNRDAGVMILNATGNLVGVETSDATEGNVVSGNRRGVVIAGRLAAGNEISGNLIGTNADGTSVLGNSLKGIDIAGAPDNRVGSSADPAKRNVVGGSRIGIDIRGVAAAQNFVQGNSVGVSADLTIALPNRLGAVVRHEASENNLDKNIIAGNLDDGVRIVRGHANYVFGNRIGDLDYPNGGDGVEIVSGHDNVIGSHEFVLAGISTGPIEISHSVIRGNAKFGVRMVFGTNVVRANNIRQNGKGGVLILRSTGTVVTSNAIDRNDGPGVLIDRSDANHVTGNVIGNRFIEFGNDVGVEIHRANDNVIGGLSFSDGNSIIGNRKQGVYIYDASTGNRIEGNEIGVTGFRIVCAPFDDSCLVMEMTVAGNGRDGVLIESSGNIVGGAADGAGNVISANLQNGVRLRGDGNAVQGNAIGTDPQNSMPVPNGADGVRIQSSGNIIGGSADGAGNLIAHNSNNGVRITSGTGNTVSQNTTFENGDLGIDLANQGPNANDAPDDPDTGPNNLQNTPTITSALILGANLEIVYSVPSSVDNAAYPITVEFFLADSDGEEGETFLGSHEYSAPGDASVSLLIGPVVDGSNIVATATDAAGNTSEFSAAVPVEPSFPAAPTAAVVAKAGKPATTTA